MGDVSRESDREARWKEEQEEEEGCVGAPADVSMWAGSVAVLVAVGAGSSSICDCDLLLVWCLPWCFGSP